MVASAGFNLKGAIYLVDQEVKFDEYVKISHKASTHRIFSTVSDVGLHDKYSH